MKPVLSLLFVCSLSTALDAYDVPGPTALEVLATDLKNASHLPPSSLVLTARLHRRDDKDFLVFRLTNSTTKQITVQQRWLPWIYPPSVRLGAVTTLGMPILPRHYDSGRLPDVSINIKPGQALEGEFMLVDVLRYEEAVKTHDILVMWAACADGDPVLTPHLHPLCTGVVTIPKRK